MLVGPYCNDVNDWLTVGGDLDLAEDVTGKTYAEIIDDLVGHGVTHVLDLRSEWEDERAWLFCAPDVVYRHSPVIDKWGHIPDERWFATIENFVRHFQSNRAEGDRLYMHCHMGINRAPSAAMLALLTTGEVDDPWDAFMAIRRARDVAGLVYATPVGIRHIVMSAGEAGQVLSEDTTAQITEWVQRVKDYWTPERLHARRQGIAWYRSHEGGTLVVDNSAAS